MSRKLVALAGLVILTACGGSNTPTTPSSLGKVDRIAAEVPSSMKGQTIQIATDATHEPNEFVDVASGNITGWDVDFGTELCTEMGVQCQYQNVTFSSIITQLKATSSRYQFSLSSWSPTQDRENSGIDFISYYKPA